MKKRRLSDLYVRGSELSVDDGSDDPVTVWLQKLNGIDRESCIRRSHAAKARYLLETDNVESETYQAIYSQIRSIEDQDSLIGLIIAEDLARERQRAEAELGTDEETWGKENYLQGLVDSWVGDEENPGLAAVKVQDPDDPEALRVEAELDRFEAEVKKAVTSYHERLMDDWKDAPSDRVWHEATKALLDLRSKEVFTNEFERQQVFYSVRDPAHKDRRYFGTLAEVDDLDPKIYEQILTSYNTLMVNPIEGKDSRASQSSSNSSDPSSAEEAQQDSGPEAVSA